MKLVVSPAAANDLQTIADYTFETWGTEQETRYLKGLWARLEEIRKRPESCPRRDELLKGCRSARHEKHVIFFAVQNDTLEVIRILHASMDFSSHLRDVPNS